MCLVPLLRYSASNIGVTLKSGLEVVQGHWKWRRSTDHIRLIGLHCSYSSVLHDFRVNWRSV